MADCSTTDVLNILEPGQSETIDDLLERGKLQKVRILLGTESPERKGHVPYARTNARITFDNEAALRECVRLLRWSDERLRALPDQRILWDWSVTFRDGMTISFGVNWYDREFFEKRKDAFTEPKHAAYYMKFGAKPGDLNIKHIIKGDKEYEKEVLKHMGKTDNDNDDEDIVQPEK
jgi:hypothetical protein